MSRLLVATPCDTHTALQSRPHPMHRSSLQFTWATGCTLKGLRSETEPVTPLRRSKPKGEGLRGGAQAQEEGSGLWGC